MTPSQPAHVYVIAEAGVNHNGDINLALRLVDAAAEAGADAVKFQTFRADRLARKDADKAPYQKAATGGSESQYEMLKRLELDEAAHAALIAHCRDRGIAFLSTPFDEQSLAFLAAECGIDRLKLGSGELTNGPLLLAAARTGLPVILSTGMATLGEVESALAVLAYGYIVAEAPTGWRAIETTWTRPEARTALQDKVALLHCTTAYPTPVGEVNLRAMDTLAAAFGLPVGYSDHTAGIHVSIAAAARGATVLEKHLTLDRTMPGPDHAASLEPEELRALVAAVRDVTAALGDGRKALTPTEATNRIVARKSLVAARPIAHGTVLAAGDITVKRPSGGLSPMAFWDMVGRTAQRDYAADEVLS